MNESNSGAGASEDPADMLGAVRGLPEQLADGWRRYRDLALPSSHRSPRAVVLTGMGGSAIGGDLVASLLAQRLAAPVVVQRHYELPGWLRPGDLVVATSHSGATEETVAAFHTAGDRGAERVAISSGGPLAELAAAAGVPWLALPAGGQPRAALGASLAAILATLHSAEVVPDPSDTLAEAVDAMRAVVATDQPGGSPETLAAALRGRVPVIVAAEDMAPVARRWKTQVNENAKRAAVWETLPELNHNTVVGWTESPEQRSLWHYVLLDAADQDPRLRRRFRLTERLLDEQGIPSSTFEAPSGDRLAQGLWLVQLGDLVSVRLAYLGGHDPTPVPQLLRLKAALAAPTENSLDTPSARD